jgi:hypothetical protein
MLPFRGVHFDGGGGSVPYLDGHNTGRAAAEVKITFPLRRFPDWSIAVTTSSVKDVDTTSFIVSRSGWSTPYHPELVSTTAAFEVQRRWDQDRRVHPIGTMSAGALMNTYSYYDQTPDGEFLREPGKRWKAYGQVSGGAEVTIVRWLRANALLGHRSGGRMTIPGARGSNGGVTMMLNLQLGKF